MPVINRLLLTSKRFKLDDLSIIGEVRDLCNLAHEEWITFKVFSGSNICKLPPLWKDYEKLWNIELSNFGWVIQHNLQTWESFKRVFNKWRKEREFRVLKNWFLHQCLKKTNGQCKS